MPLEMIELTDQLTDLITFQISPAYEMMLSLRTLLDPGHHTEWVARMREELPGAFWEELRAVYEPYENGSLFLELGIDYPDQEDVPGFIDYVRSMEPVDFVFYLVGRIVTREQIIATGLDHARLIDAVVEETRDTHFMCHCLEVPLEQILADVPAFQRRLANLWEWYWTDFFETQIEDFRPHWQHSLNEKMAYLATHGGQALFEHVSNRRRLPDPLPLDHPVTEVTFIPLYLIPAPVYMFYGYGNVTIMFDSERTEARLAEIARNKEQALAAFKALGDNTRLEILRLIANRGGAIHGKKIAAWLELSPSAVSRHLAQLRDARLIVEQTHPDRTITYQLQTERIQALPQELLDYLYH